MNELALDYIDETSDLPVDISDLEVDFVQDQVHLSAIVPLGFFRLELTASAVWRAENCRFRAELLDMRIGGQPAPASLRNEVEALLSDALISSNTVAACFTRVQITEDRVIISGYKE